jgi:hypothetical protein
MLPRGTDGKIENPLSRISLSTTINIQGAGRRKSAAQQSLGRGYDVVSERAFTDAAPVIDQLR